MKNSSIITNLENKIEPVSKEEREYFEIPQEFEKWLFPKGEYELNGIYLGQNKENLQAYEKLIDILREKEKIAIIYDILKHMESKDVPDEISTPDLIANYPTHLDYWLSSIAEEVDGMLGCTAEFPEIYLDKNIIGGTAIYHSKTRRIGIASGIGGSSVAFNAGHEYCHHMQDHSKAPLPWFLCKTISEGFADNVGMNATRIYAEKSGNLIVQSAAQNRLWQDIKYFCLRLEKEGEPYGDDKFYAVGGTAFLVAEAMHGKTIYREIIRSAEPAEYLIKKLDSPAKSI